MTTKTENTKTNGRGGKRSGAGRKQGRLSIKTLKKMAIKRELDQRVMGKADQLFNAQYAKAVGSIQVFRIDETEAGKKTHVLITDPEEIKDVLDATSGNGGVVGEDFYFVADVLPDNRALDSLFDRTFGKASQSLQITETQDAAIEAVLEEIKHLLAEYPSIANSRPKLAKAITTICRGREIPKERLLEKLVTEIPEISNKIQ